VSPHRKKVEKEQTFEGETTVAKAFSRGLQDKTQVETYRGDKSGHEKFSVANKRKNERGKISCQNKNGTKD